MTIGWVLFFLTYAMGALALDANTHKYEPLPRWSLIFWMPVVVVAFVSALVKVSISIARAALTKGGADE